MKSLLILKTLLLPRFLAREKFDQLVTRPTHIKGGEDSLYFVSLCILFVFMHDLQQQILIIASHIESIILGLIDHAHLRRSEKKLRTIVTQESHYFTDHDSINVTFKNF